MNGAHIDSPRLDLKPNPLFEQADIAYLKPHYYGGIRKYQWGSHSAGYARCGWKEERRDGGDLHR